MVSDSDLTIITGTNGKTTIASLLYQLFEKAGYTVGLLSTVKVMVADQEFKATHTTPDSLTINKYLAKMNEAGVEYCFMEVSSHGIHQKRTEGLKFTGGIFTNLSHDHLDYHNTFAEYRDVKKKFFDDSSEDEDYNAQGGASSKKRETSAMHNLAVPSVDPDDYLPEGRSPSTSPI